MEMFSIINHTLPGYCFSFVFDKSMVKYVSIIVIFCRQIFTQTLDTDRLGKIVIASELKFDKCECQNQGQYCQSIELMSKSGCIYSHLIINF